LQDAAKRAEVKVIILKASGEVFCSGHDRLEIVRQPAATSGGFFKPPSLDGHPADGASVHYCSSARHCHGRRLSSCGRMRFDHGGKGQAKFGMTGLIYSYNCSTPTVALSRAVPQKKCFECS